MPPAIHDVVIIGAGPTGLSCAIQCQKRDMDVLLLEKGSLVNSIYHFPTNMVFFTTSDLLEIGEIPFASTNLKPNLLEGVMYYKRVAQHYKLNIKTGQRVTSVSKEHESFMTEANDHLGNEMRYRSKFVIVATGYFDSPNMLNIPGEDLPKVTHYYTDPHPYFQKNVLVIGGKNSAAIAALELSRYGANVTMVHRGPEVKKSVKYWILPDFLNRVKEELFELHLNTVAAEITETTVRLRNNSKKESFEIPNDYVLILTGYRPDVHFLEACKIKYDTGTLKPEINEETFETNVINLYVAGSIVAGLMNNEIFIENGRFHGKTIAADIYEKLRGN